MCVCVCVCARARALTFDLPVLTSLYRLVSTGSINSLSVSGSYGQHSYGGRG